MKREIATFLLGVIALLIASSGSIYQGDIKGKVVCFGDSITNGAEVDGDSWVHYLKQSHPDLNFVNAGRNGRKTADKSELIPVLNSHPDADYFLIFLGVNDLKNGNKEMVEECVHNMEWMIEKVRATNPETNIVILAPTDINLQTMAPINVQKKYNKNTRQSLVMLGNRYKELAEKESTAFISLLDAVSPPNYTDGLHPNRAGQQEVAAVVWKGLKDLYK